MERYLTYYSQKGGSYNIFRGSQYGQTGRGFGSIFKSIARFVTPLFRPVAKSLGVQGLAMGKRLFDDVLAGENLKESLKKNSKIAGANLLTNLAETVANRQSGSGRRTIRKRKKQQTRRTKTKKRRTKLDFLD